MQKIKENENPSRLSAVAGSSMKRRANEAEKHRTPKLSSLDAYNTRNNISEAQLYNSAKEIAARR